MVKKNNWYSFENVAYIQLIKILITEAFIFALIVLMVFAKPNILKIYIVTSHLRTRRQTLIVLPWGFAAFWLSEAEQNSWRICNGIKIKVLRGWKYIKVGPICHYCDLILPKLGFLWNSRLIWIAAIVKIRWSIQGEIFPWDGWFIQQTWMGRNHKWKVKNQFFSWQKLQQQS